MGQVAKLPRGFIGRARPEVWKSDLSIYEKYKVSAEYPKVHEGGWLFLAARRSGSSATVRAPSRGDSPATAQACSNSINPSEFPLRS